MTTAPERDGGAMSSERGRIFDSGWSLIASLGIGVREWRAEHESAEVAPVVFTAPYGSSRQEVLAALAREARKQDARAYRPLLRATWAEETGDGRRGDDVRQMREW